MIRNKTVQANYEAAVALGEKTYQGRACRKGHQGRRLTNNGQCADCYGIKLARRRADYGTRCKHPSYELLKEAKKRARQTGRDFNLELSDIIIPERCPISLRPMVKHTTDAPSLDRIDNTRGYVKGNVMVISRRMNTAKSDLTADEAMRLAQFMQLLA